MVDLYFLTPAVIAKLFNPTVELAKPRKISTNESNAEMDIRNINKKMLKKF